MEGAKLARAVYLDEETCATVRREIARAFPAPSAQIAALLDAMRRAPKRWTRRSPHASNWEFHRLLDNSGPLVFPNLENPQHFRQSAHSWAHYHGYRVVTRTDPDGTGRVWLVSKHRDAR